jgi:putative oxidoreductase
MNAHFIAGLELMGGVLLVLGLASRPIGLLLSVNMLVAYITADREALLSLISDPDKFTAAAPFTFLVASLIVLIFGSGRFSVDAWIRSKNWFKVETATGVQPSSELTAYRNALP